MVKGTTKIFGLLGNPIKHTISPYIHGLLYRETGYDGTYNPFYVAKDRLEDAVNGIWGLGIEGVNVTVPFKVEVMDYLDEIDSMAEAIGAVNTLVRNGHRLVGYNTDWIGLKMACDYEKIPIKDKDVVIIGAGGSARAVAFMCAKEGAKTITIFNRTVEKARHIADSVNGLFNGQNPEFKTFHQSVQVGDLTALNQKVPLERDSYKLANDQEELAKVKQGALVFQTTSLGLAPYIEQSPVTNEAFFKKVDFIVDIIYNPKETAFMKMGYLHGVKCANGLGMLFFQAVKAFEIWTDKRLDENQLGRVFGELENQVYNITKS